MGDKGGVKRVKATTAAAAEGPKSHGGMLAEAFQEHTEQFRSEEDRRQEGRELEREAEVKRLKVLGEEKEKREKAEEERKRREEHKAVFRRGAKKARNEIFSGKSNVLLPGGSHVSRASSETYVLTSYINRQPPHLHGRHLLQI